MMGGIEAVGLTREACSAKAASERIPRSVDSVCIVLLVRCCLPCAVGLLVPAFS